MASDPAAGRPDNGGVPGYHDGGAETVEFRATWSRQLPNLAPVVGAAPVPLEEVGRTLVVLVFEVGAECADDGCASVDRHGGAEIVLGLAIRCRQLPDLAPVIDAAPVPLEEVSRALIMVASDLVSGRSDDDHVSIDRRGAA